MSCQTDIPIKDIADIVGEDFIAKEGGKGTDTTLIDPRIRGDVALDKGAKEALCDALGPCITDALEPLETEIDRVDQKADEAANAANNAMDAAQSAGEAANAATEAAQSAERTALNKAVARVLPDGDKRVIVLQDGTKIPFFVTDQSVPVEPLYQDEKVVGFGIKGDNVVITMIDGTEHDLTRQEFADWLAAQDTPLATDNELAEAIAQGTGVLQEQIDTLNQGLDSLQAQIDAFDADQAMLFTRDGKLVLRNEDNTEHEVPLADLIPLSPDDGNLLEVRENGIYYGIQADPSVANLFVDKEYGDDSVSPENGGGSIEKPLKTLRKALSLVATDKTSVINLKAVDSNGLQQTYVAPYAYGMKGRAIRKFVSYGQTFFTKDLIKCLASNTSFSPKPYKAVLWDRAKIVREWRKIKVGSTYYQTALPFFLEDGGFEFYGVEIEANLPKYDVSEYPIYANALFYGSGTVRIDGVITRGTNSGTSERFYTAPAGSKLSISIVDSYIDGDFQDTIISAIDTNVTILTATENVASQNAASECGIELQDLEKIPNNFRTKLQEAGGISGIVRGNSGDPLNVSANFLI